MQKAAGSLADQVASELVRWIEREGLVPGAELPPVAELADVLGVSVPVVREAIRTLAARELLVTGQGRRIRVGAPSARVLGQLIEYRLRRRSLEPHDLVATRQLVEVEATRLTAVRVASGEVDPSVIVTALETMERSAGHREDFVAGDVAFHAAIAESSGNGVMALLLEALTDVLTDERRRTYDARQRTVGNHDQTILGHRRVLDAIVAGDPAAAESTMRAHFADVAADLDGAVDDR